MPTSEDISLNPPLETDFLTAHILRPSKVNIDDLSCPNSLIADGQKLIARNPAVKQELFRSTFDNTPALPAAYGKWYKQVSAYKEAQWKKQGIDRAIHLSTYPLLVRAPLVLKMSAF